MVNNTLSVKYAMLVTDESLMILRTAHGGWEGGAHGDGRRTVNHDGAANKVWPWLRSRHARQSNRQRHSIGTVLIARASCGPESNAPAHASTDDG